MIRPIPLNRGVGFFSMERLPEFSGKYREENVGRYWNYYVTPDHYDWPDKVKYNGPYVIDGFSPNLNKNLHVGHLRQLALAKSLDSILNSGGLVRAKLVALLGASQGVYKYAQDALKEWFYFVNYHPELHYDVLMPRDQEIVPRYKAIMPVVNEGDTPECEVWDGPKGPVKVVRADGRPLYAFHDIAFANIVKPTHYITGIEQKEHFESLGLGDKHLPMGIVLGSDNKKMKSRTGDAVTAKEVLDQIIAQLDPTPEPKKLAWNVLSWNFLHVARDKNVKYTPADWTKPDSPGMYITYTFARLKSALKNENSGLWISPHNIKAIHHKWRPSIIPAGSFNYDESCEIWSKANPDPNYDLIQSDADLLGVTNQHTYYLQRTIDTLDPAVLANYAFDLASKLSEAYHGEKIAGGRYGFKYAVYHGTSVLRQCMWELGMFPLEQV